MKKIPIKDRDDQKDTPYYRSRRMTDISGIGKLPKKIMYKWNNIKQKEDAKDVMVYNLSVVTKDFIYYMHKDADDISGTIMLERNVQLVSDNFFASNDLCSVVLENKDIIWMSKSVKYWQRVYVQMDSLSPQIVSMLNNVDIQKLEAKEKAIFFAFLDQGPVKYTKPESLMAVLSNDLGYYTSELENILTLLNNMKKTHRDSQENIP